jgi:hypothetical protein
LVQFEFTANRDRLFAARNAIANLAGMAGTVKVDVALKLRFDTWRPPCFCLGPGRLGSSGE